MFVRMNTALVSYSHIGLSYFFLIYRIWRNKRTVRLKNDYGNILVVKSLIGVKNWDIVGYL